MNFEQIKPNDYYNGFLELLNQLADTDKSKISYNDFSKILSNNNNIIIIVAKNDEGVIIATGTIIIEQKFIHNLGKVGHIEDVVVDTNYYRKGIGRELINNLINIGRENGCYKIILDCDENIKKFYEKCDFSYKNIQMAKYF